MLHPLIIAISVVDAVGALLLLSAAWVAVGVLMGWRPGHADRAQLRLERRLEAASMQGRLAWGLWLLGTLAWGAAVAGVLPDLVPGAMCGTGVMEAMGASGGRTALLRGLALVALAGWHLIDRLDRSTPGGPLAEAGARALLLATPVALLSAWETWSAFSRLDTTQAVDCCAVVYDAVTASHGQGLLAGVTPEAWITAMLAGAVGVFALALRAVWRRRAGATLGLLAPAWALVAAGALVQVLAAYHYEVLHHRCPWCLFLAEHGRVGYPLFGALAVVVAEGGAAWIAASVARRQPALAEPARRRVRQAGWRVLLAATVYLALAVWPAVAWRLAFGVWMSG